MAPRLAIFGLAVVMLAAGCLSEKTPGYCSTDLECPSGTRCKLDSPKKNSCVPQDDGGTDGPIGDGSLHDSDSHVDGLPGEVPPPCMPSSCGTAAPICDSTSKTCRVCSNGSECATLNSATPACVAGRCVSCSMSGDCKVGGQPVCDSATNQCRACGSGAECMAVSTARPVCLASGACAECGKSSDCGVATKPICDMTSNACRACTSGPECAALSAATPACSPSGQCVECVGSSDCKTTTKPVCDTTSNKCRACQADAECPSDPGVCLANIDGHCATPGETIYVENSGSCSDAVAASDTTAATSTKPLCSMQPVSMFLSSTRALVRIRGTVSGATSGFTSSPTPKATFVGQLSAVVAASVNPAFDLQSGTAFIRGIGFSSSASTGIRATGGTLHLDTVTVDSCKKGGILLDGAAFDIRNTTVTNNSMGQQGATAWGGILVNALPATGPTQLGLVTIQNNKQIGLTCIGPISGIGVLSSGNTGGDISTTCGITACSPAGPACGAP